MLSDIGNWMYQLVNIPWWTTARVTATVAVVAATAGYFSARTAIRSLAQTRKDSRARSRPMMSAELKIADDDTLNLIVKNSGVSIARNVLVAFDPPLPNDRKSSDGQGNFGWLINRRYALPIPVWVPGREMENYYWLRDDTSPDDSPRSVDGIPRLVEVTITYSDDEGTTYTDVFPLDEREFNGAARPIRTVKRGNAWTDARDSAKGRVDG